MALKSLLGKLTGKSDRGSWQPSAGPYPRLMLLDKAVVKALPSSGGLYALWHRGVRPQWVYIGHAADLSGAVAVAQEDHDVSLYDLNDGVYLAWTECPPETRAGAVLYLRTLLEPALQQSPLDAFGPVDPEAAPVEFPPPVD